jgi:hypothetical protein
MADFREVLDCCELRDIGFSGVPWTYDNRENGIVVWQLKRGSKQYHPLVPAFSMLGMRR